VIRIAHTGDWHLTSGPRFADTLRCLRAVYEDGVTQKVQLWIVGGDLSGVSVPHVASVDERLALSAQLFQPMADHAPVLILYGNHDAENDLAIYGRLAARHPIVVVPGPRILELAAVRLFAIPFPLKRRYVAPHQDLSIPEQNAAIARDIRALLEAWRPEVEVARRDGIPTVCIGHGTIRGAAIAGGEVIPEGQEIEFSVEDLEMLGCDYTAFSHFHLCQQLRAGIWYAGSPDRSNFGEVDEKGFLIVDIEPGQPPVVHRRLTPARRFLTVEATWSETEGWRLDMPVGAHDVANTEVRLRVTVPEEARDVSEAWIASYETQLRDKLAAHAVVVERRIIPTTRVRSEAITTARTTAEKLGAFWASLNSSGPSEMQRTRALERLGELETEGPDA